MTRTIKEFAKAIPNGMEYKYDFYDGEEQFATLRFEAILGVLFVHPNMVRYLPQEFRYFKRMMQCIGKAIATDLGYKHLVCYTKNPKMVKLFGTETTKQIGAFMDYGVYQQDIT